jgi:tripartite-type tricarboxylate transporter receptor subunit TctC
VKHRALCVARAAATVALGVVAIGLLIPWGARAQTGTIKIVVPLPAGGGVDVVARQLAEQIGQSQGATFVIENRPGAGTMIGTEAVARANPDGNTLLVVPNSFVVAPQLHKANYDPIASFTPICSLVATPTVLAVNKSSPYRTLAELVAAAHAEPGKLTMGSGGGAALQLNFEMLQQTTHIRTTFVAYSGTVPAVIAALGGHIDAVFSDFPTAWPQIKSGALRALATGARTRLESLPAVPTIDESGYPGYEAEIWYGLFAPAQTPPEVTARLAGWFAAAVQDAGVKAKLAAQGLRPVGLCGEQFREQVRAQYDTFGRVIREAGIKAE